MQNRPGQIGAYRSGRDAEATPIKTVALLYDRICESLNLAMVAIDNGSSEARHNATAKACRIITSLAAYLDFEQGGEIAVHLHELYRFVLARLVSVDLNNDKEPLQDALVLLEPIRDAWHELSNRLESVGGDGASEDGSEAKRPAVAAVAVDDGPRIAYGSRGTTTVENRATATRIEV